MYNLEIVYKQITLLKLINKKSIDLPLSGSSMVCPNPLTYPNVNSLIKQLQQLMVALNSKINVQYDVIVKVMCLVFVLLWCSKDDDNTDEDDLIKVTW